MSYFQRQQQLRAVYGNSWATLYTDASRKEGKTSWAFWLRHSGGRIVKAGECPQEVTNIQEAEWYAVKMGVEALVGLNQVDKLVVVCDNSCVVAGLAKNFKGHPYSQEIKRGILDYCIKMRIAIYPKLKKTQLQKSEACGFIHNQVDAIAGSLTGKNGAREKVKNRYFPLAEQPM